MILCSFSLLFLSCVLGTVGEKMQRGAQGDQSIKQDETTSSGRKTLPKVPYDKPSWWDLTGKNLRILCDRITSLVSHRHWKVSLSGCCKSRVFCTHVVLYNSYMGTRQLVEN